MDTGFLIINKPTGWTSFDVVGKLRSITKIKKIGHCGTLDPLATGVLIVAVGREATREIDRFHLLPKTYIAKAKFGCTSDTYDIEGEVVETKLPENFSLAKEYIQSELTRFIGTIEQMPPIFSAKKINGVAAYKLARQGKEVELKTATVEIFSIDILNFNYPEIELQIHCGSGTYVRSIIHDLGQALKCGAIMTDLVRTAIGKSTLDHATNIDTINNENWQNLLKSQEELLTN